MWVTVGPEQWWIRKKYKTIAKWCLIAKTFLKCAISWKQWPTTTSTEKKKGGIRHSHTIAGGGWIEWRSTANVLPVEITKGPAHTEKIFHKKGYQSQWGWQRASLNFLFFIIFPFFFCFVCAFLFFPLRWNPLEKKKKCYLYAQRAFFCCWNYNKHFLF